MPETTAQTPRIVQPTIFREEIVSKPGATLEVRAIEIPETLQRAIARGLQQGRAEAAEGKK
jgi:hypothetical protein